MVRKVNKEGGEVLAELLRLAEENNGYIKIDNNGKDSGIMPVSVEVIGRYDNGRKVLSVAHYYEQNGDLMRDPEMTFLVVDYMENKEKLFYPMSFTQDNIGKYEESLYLTETGDFKQYRPRQQKDQAIFAGQWMRNIKWQQLTKSKAA